MVREVWARASKLVCARARLDDVGPVSCLEKGRKEGWNEWTEREEPFVSVTGGAWRIDDVR